MVYTPGQAYFWSHIIRTLVEKGHQALVIARPGKLTEEVLKRSHIPYSTCGQNGRTTCGKLLRLPLQFITSFRLLLDFNPDLIAGASLLESHASAILRKPCIVFEDTEITPSLERLQWQATASSIVTPACFKLDLGQKHIRMQGYKELAYLHPAYFQPDPAIYEEMEIPREQKYAVIRFNSFNAVHDIRLRGLALEDKYRIVKLLGQHVRVFICAEGFLPPDLESYRLQVPSSRIHHVLNYAQLVMGDSGTITTEAAVLGTPAIRCNSGLGLNELGNFVELEQKYGLLYCAQNLEDILPRALELVQNPDSKKEWAGKRQRMLEEKVDVTRFMVDMIENYPRGRSQNLKVKSQNYIQK